MFTHLIWTRNLPTYPNKQTRVTADAWYPRGRQLDRDVEQTKVTEHHECHNINVTGHNEYHKISVTGHHECHKNNVTGHHECHIINVTGHQLTGAVVRSMQLISKSTPGITSTLDQQQDPCNRYRRNVMGLRQPQSNNEVVIKVNTWDHVNITAIGKSMQSLSK